MNPTLVRILELLRRHAGQANAISADEIALQIGLKTACRSRLVRELLAEAEDDGTLEELELPVVGIGGQGFFIATTYEEFALREDILWQLLQRAVRKYAAWLRICVRHGFRFPQRKTPPTSKP